MTGCSGRWQKSALGTGPTAFAMLIIGRGLGLLEMRKRLDKPGQEEKSLGGCSCIGIVKARKNRIRIHNGSGASLQPPLAGARGVRETGAINARNSTRVSRPEVLYVANVGQNAFHKPRDSFIAYSRKVREPRLRAIAHVRDQVPPGRRKAVAWFAFKYEKPLRVGSWARMQAMRRSTLHLHFSRPLRR